MRLLAAFGFAVLAYAQDPAGMAVRNQVESAERPAIDLAREWIKDPQPIRRAWAAELFRRNGLVVPVEELTGELGDTQGEIRNVPDGPITDLDRKRAAILDALIQMDLSIPSEQALKLFPRFPAQVILLLYRRNAPPIPVSGSILDNAKTLAAWLVAAETLATQPRGPVELVRRFRVTAQIKVFDPDRGERDLGLNVRGVPGGAFGPVTPDGWPQVYSYLLEARAPSQCTDQVLRSGNYPVVHRRATFGSTAGSEIPFDRNQRILELLGEPSGLAAASLTAVSKPQSHWTEFHWTTAEQYRSDMQAFRADQQRRHAEFLARLVKRRLLTQQEADACPLQLDITVIDRRQDQSQSIPDTGFSEQIQR